MSEPAPASPPAPRRPARLLLLGGLATVAVGFLLGFVIGGRPAERTDSVAAGTVPPATSSTTTAAPTTTTDDPAPSTTERPTTTEAPTTVTTEAVTTTAPTTAPPPTSVATTAAPTTSAAPPVSPSRVLVSYATDGHGRLVLPRQGSATLVITNEGGLPQQWLVTGTGFSVAGSNQGTIAPGQTVTITVLAPREELPSNEVNGTISVLGAVNPAIPFVIPPA